MTEHYEENEDRRSLDQAAFRVFVTSSSAIRCSTKSLSFTKAGSSGDRSADCSTRASVERRISTRRGDASTMCALDAAMKGLGRPIFWVTLPYTDGFGSFSR